jgi:hypothetical protein
MLKNGKEKELVKSYVELVKEAQGLPTHPMVFLMTPYAGKDMRKTINSVAHLSNIPESNILNAWNLLRVNPPHDTPMFNADNVHPTVRASGILAQEAFMMMSYNKEYLSRQQKVMLG